MSEPSRCPAHRGAADLVDPTLHGEHDPHPIWTELRRRDPVSRQSTPDGQEFWSVTRYADVERVMRDHDTFTSQRGTLLYLIGKDDPAGGRQMAATDPPRHGELREPLQRALAAKQTQAKRERIREVIVELLEPLAGGGEYDLAEHANRMPMAVAGVLMDIPASDWSYLVDLTTAAVAPQDPRCARKGTVEAVLNAAHRELFAYFHTLVRRRRERTGDDLVSLLLRMELDGRPLTTGEIVSNCYSLLLGANVTTAQVPVFALHEVMGTPAAEEWADHRELLSSGVEEALRWATPTTHFMRYATADVILGGRRVSTGDAVVIWLGSANRDEDVFDDPFRFDVRRRPNKHLTFGIGPHYCVGHSVARVTLRLFFAELFSRFTDLAPAGPGERLYSNTISGWTRFPITAKPRRTRGPVAY